jgi:hypothetical protein
MPDHNSTNLTADQIEQVIRLSIPAMKEAIQPGLDGVKDTVSKLVDAHQSDMTERLEKVNDHLSQQDKRIRSLEGLAKWAIGAAAATGVFLTAIFETIRWYFFTRK